MMFSGLGIESLKAVNEKRYREILEVLHYFKIYETLKTGKRLGLTYPLEKLDDETFFYLNEIDHYVEEEKAKRIRKSNGPKSNIRHPNR